jgi:hypothetical protein
MRVAQRQGSVVRTSLLLGAIRTLEAPDRNAATKAVERSSRESAAPMSVIGSHGGRQQPRWLSA